MQALAQWLAGTPASQGIQREEWLIPLLQSVHIVAIAMVLSSVVMVDLRILGVGRSQTMVQTARRFVPWLWTGLVILAATGAALIIGEPKRSLPNAAFQLKMVLLALAIAVTVAFQLSLRRNIRFWEEKRAGRTFTAILAVATFVLWCAIAIAGRWIAYVADK
jgi:hypothetical protein